jgi:hypothetical protein
METGRRTIAGPKTQVWLARAMIPKLWLPVSALSPKRRITSCGARQGDPGSPNRRVRTHFRRRVSVEWLSTWGHALDEGTVAQLTSRGFRLTTHPCPSRPAIAARREEGIRESRNREAQRDRRCLHASGVVTPMHIDVDLCAAAIPDRHVWPSSSYRVNMLAPRPRQERYAAHARPKCSRGSRRCQSWE